MALPSAPVIRTAQADPVRPAAIRPLKILHFNMAGATVNHGGSTVVDRIFDKIQSEGVDVISLNEVCLKQFGRLQRLLDEAGADVHGYFSTTRLIPEARCGLAEDLPIPDQAGSAVFARANIRDQAEYVYQSAPFTDRRAAACVTAEFQVWTRVCTTHTSPQDNGDRSLAAAEVRELATSLFPAATRRLPLIIAGDLNLPPDWPSPEDPAIAAMYAPEAGGTGDYWEVDQFGGCPTCAPTPGGAATHNEGKLDYVFVSAAHFERAVSARVEDAGECDGDHCSDHRMLIGDVGLRTNEPVRMFHFDMCGTRVDAGPCTTGSPDDAPSAVASSILDFRPDVVTLTEVCAAQVTMISEFVGGNGYQMHSRFAPSGVQRARCSGGPLGTAILSHAPLTESEVMPLPGGSAEEQDALVCARTAVRDRTAAVCATRLSADPGDREAQGAAVAERIDALVAADIPVILGGTFEARPQSAVLTPLYAHHGGTGRLHEVDETDREYYGDNLPGICQLTEPNCRSGESTVPIPLAEQNKLDYIFVSDHFAALDGDATRSAVSGHVPLRGWATLLAGDGVPAPVPGGPPPVGQDLPPSVSAGPDVTGQEGRPLRLTGSAQDPEGVPDVTWTISPEAGVDQGAACSLAEARAANTTVTCTDDGTFRATLTASDGTNAPVSDTARVRLANVAPRPSMTAPAPWSVWRAGTRVDVAASISDPGVNDTHTCAVDWDDGTTESFPATGASCARGHVFAAGMYTIKVTVTDDDGGSGTADVLVVVYDPDGGFATAGAQVDSPAGALVADPDVSGVGSFQFNPRYLPWDAGPAPTGGKVRFRLADAGFALESTALDWLVVTPDGKAAVKGEAAVGGRPEYGFVAYVYDQPDRLRLIVWSLAEGPIPGSAVIYDNRHGAGLDLDVADPRPLLRGGLRVHR